MICQDTDQFQYFPTHTFEFMHLISSLALIHTLLLLFLVFNSYSVALVSCLFLPTPFFHISCYHLLLVCFFISIKLTTCMLCHLNLTIDSTLLFSSLLILDHMLCFNNIACRSKPVTFAHCWTYWSMFSLLFYTTTHFSFLSLHSLLFSFFTLLAWSCFELHYYCCC